MKWSTLRNLVSADIDSLDAERFDTLETVRYLRDEGYSWEEVDGHLIKMLEQNDDNPNPITAYFKG